MNLDSVSQIHSYMDDMKENSSVSARMLHVHIINNSIIPSWKLWGGGCNINEPQLLSINRNTMLTVNVHAN